MYRYTVIVLFFFVVAAVVGSITLFSFLNIITYILLLFFLERIYLAQSDICGLQYVFCYYENIFKEEAEEEKQRQ